MERSTTRVDSTHPQITPGAQACIMVGLFFLAQGVAALLVGFAALFLSFEPVLVGATEQAACSRPERRPVRLAAAENRRRLRRGHPARHRCRSHRVGPDLRARVTQIFRNPTQDWVEATYVYPLAEGGAVDTLKMVVGDRVVVGDIKERQQARVIYEQARANGQKAALTEQERPNIFTNSVANIGPGETVLVQIEYQEPVQQSGNEFSLRVPLVVGPRYNPAPVVQSVDLRTDGGGWGSTTTDPVPDRDRISPPVLDPAQERAGQSDQHHGAPAGRLPARRGEEPPSRRQDRKPRQHDAHHHARRRRRCPPTAISS